MVVTICSDVNDTRNNCQKKILSQTFLIEVDQETLLAITDRPPSLPSRTAELSLVARSVTACQIKLVAVRSSKLILLHPHLQTALNSTT